MFYRDSIRSLTIIFSLLGFLQSFSSASQSTNLVPNPSFEDHTSCPTTQGEIQKAFPWDRPPGSFTTPDFHHRCSPPNPGCVDSVGVPNNFAGTVDAFDQDGYLGLVCYYPTPCPNCREYAQVKLDSPLVSGKEYHVRFAVHLGPQVRFATSNIGIYFSQDILYQDHNQSIDSVTPQVVDTNLLDNRNYWKVIKGKYAAQGGEQYITIGNFQMDSASKTHSFASYSSDCLFTRESSYYFIDSVYVGLPCSGKVFPSDTAICLGDSLKLVAKGGNGYDWLNGDTASSVKVKPPGDTTYQVVIDQPCGLDTFDIAISIDSVQGPRITGDSLICEGDSAHLLASGGEEYHWAGHGQGSILSVAPRDTSLYQVTAMTVCDTATSSKVVMVDTLPLLTTQGDTVLELGNTVPLLAKTANSELSWAPDNGLSCVNCPTPVASPRKATVYVATAIAPNGCKTSDSILVDVVPLKGEIYIPNIFSPNDNNRNDVFKIYGGTFQEFEMLIFDRWGNEVFQSNSEEKGWDGTYMGNPMEPAAFVYIVRGVLSSGKEIDRKGTVTLVR